MESNGPVFNAWEPGTRILTVQIYGDGSASIRPSDAHLATIIEPSGKARVEANLSAEHVCELARVTDILMRHFET
jgi:hypothetical protein